jgi:hypothetical protein
MTGDDCALTTVNEMGRGSDVVARKLAGFCPALIDRGQASLLFHRIGCVEQTGGRRVKVK